MVRRFALRWWTCRDHNRPSARAWAKQLGVSHVWLLKLVRKFETDPGEVRRLAAYGDPTLVQLRRAKEHTQRMRDGGELRSPRRRFPAIEPAMEQFVRARFAQGWSKSRLACELFLDRRTVKRILQKVTQNSGQKP
jgi:ribosome-binding protein aMBF1 (putative translation factor)